MAGLLVFVVSFTVGERLEYAAKFGFLNLGTMVLEVTDTATIADRPCYRITSLLNSNPDLGFLFALNDTIEVSTTADMLLPVIYDKRVHEGKYAKRTTLRFDQDSLYVHYSDTLRYAIPPGTRDLLSFWYYLRRIPLVVGDTLDLIIHETKENHTIKCHVRRKDTLKTTLGKMLTVLVVPQTKGKGVFGTTGSMEIWYSDDEKRYPVQIKTRMKFGTATFKLKGVSD
jgi:hypothetical protein